MSTVEFAINNLVNSSTGLSPFFADLGYHPRAGFPELPAEVQSGRGAGAASAAEFAAEQRRIIEEVREAMLATQERMRAADEKEGARVAASISVGDEVLVSSQALLPPARRDRPADKLAFKWHGPFRVQEKLSPAAFRLDLGELKAHNVINAVFLKKYTANAMAGREPVTPEPVQGLQGLEVEVAEVLAHKRSRHTPPRWTFTIKWRGLGAGQNSVGSLEDFVDRDGHGAIVAINAALVEYARKQPAVWEELLRQGWDGVDDQEAGDG